MAFLTANNGPQAGRRYELDRPESVLGRHPECDVVIDVGAVSRYHCKVISEGTRFSVEDLNSRNGTFVNEQVIQGRTPLEDGCLVRVCDVVFTYHEVEGPIELDDDSSYRAVMVDDDASDSGGSTIMSKLDVRSSINGPLLAASAEAKLSALIEITRSLSNALSLDKVLPEVLDSLFRIFVQADRGFVGMLDEDDVLAPCWTKLRREDSDDTIRVSRTIAKQVMDTKEAILSADAASDVRFEMSQSIADIRIRSMMCAPLLDRDDNAFGILQIDTLDQRQLFREDDLELLVSTAAQASIALTNAKLHEESLKQRSIDRDLELAREVQQAFLPNRAREFPGYEFYSYYQPANDVGGDYYDFVQLPDGRLAAVIADAVGHGVAAAMLMAKLAAEMQFSLAKFSNPADAVTDLNRQLCRLHLNRFVTLQVVVIHTGSSEATIVSAGHIPPMYRQRNRSAWEPAQIEVGLPLGIVDETNYKSSSLELGRGDSLTLFTNGLSHALADGSVSTVESLRLPSQAEAARSETKEAGTAEVLIAEREGMASLVAKSHAKLRNVNEIFYVGPLLGQLQEALLAEERSVVEVLSRGFFRMVVFDCQLGLGSDDSFDSDAFQRHILSQMIRAFGYGTPIGEFHPAEIPQHLRDEPASLFCFLNAQHLPPEDFRTLRGQGFRQSKHKAFFCGPNPYFRTRSVPDFTLKQQNRTPARFLPIMHSTPSPHAVSSMQGTGETIGSLLVDNLRDCLQGYAPEDDICFVCIGRRE